MKVYKPLFCLIVTVASGQIVTVTPSSNGDDTAKLQAAIDSLPVSGILDGQSRSFNVTTLRLKSNMTLRHFQLTEKASNVPFASPVTIDGSRGLIQNVVISDVHINGNRGQQTNLLGLEDGGRSGFRIVGLASDIRIQDSSASYCATDGLQIFSGDGTLSGNDANLNFHRITVTNTRFEFNRRHGVSIDSADTLSFKTVVMNSNGLDVAGGSNEGNRGVRFSDGTLYGDGADIEGYGVGSGINGLIFDSCTAVGNARYAIQFWDPSIATQRGFLTRRNIQILNSTLAAGVDPLHSGHQALEFFIPGTSYVGRPVYENIYIQNTTITGTVIFGAVNGVNISGCTITSPFVGFWGASVATTNVVVLSNLTAGKTFATQ